MSPSHSCSGKASLTALWRLTGQAQLAFLMPDWTGQTGKAIGTLGCIKVNK